MQSIKDIFSTIQTQSKVEELFNTLLLDKEVVQIIFVDNQLSKRISEGEGFSELIPLDNGILTKQEEKEFFSQFKEIVEQTTKLSYLVDHPYQEGITTFFPMAHIQSYSFSLQKKNMFPKNKILSEV